MYHCSKQSYPGYTFTFLTVNYKELKQAVNNPEEDYIPIIEGFFSEIPADLCHCCWY